MKAWEIRVVPVVEDGVSLVEDPRVLVVEDGVSPVEDPRVVGESEVVGAGEGVGATGGGAVKLGICNVYQMIIKEKEKKKRKNQSKVSGKKKRYLVRAI